MTDEPTRVVFHLDRDPRLIAAVRGAVLYQASLAGLESESCENFATASEDVCREALSRLTDADRGLDVTLDTFPNRIEISIHHAGRLAPAVGLESFAHPGAPAGGAGEMNGLELLSRVDRVIFNTEKGAARTTLVKFLQPKH